MPETGFLRTTPQRRAILEGLRKISTHPTAAELHAVLRERLPHISLGTVYRNLELLARMGEVRRLTISGSEARFDGNLADHHHLTCDRCGRIEDLYDLPVNLGRGLDSWAVGWEILGHRLEFIGRCPACRQRFESSVVEVSS